MASPSERKVNAELFVTCIIDQIAPEVGESTVRVLRRLGVDLDFPPEQTCCGQPAFNSGYWSEAKPLARKFIETFTGDKPVVIPSGSCASMVRVFYQELFHDEPLWAERAANLAPKVFELSEFLADELNAVGQIGEIASEAKAQKTSTTYHETCHLRRELGATTQTRKLLKALPNVTLTEMPQSEVCCGFGGTFAVKYSDISGAMLSDKVNNIKASAAESVVACDSSCLMHIGGGLEKQGVNVQPLHLAQILDQAMS
ncbi:MAG: (Fe-S)-binding protein [Chloroflexi bacterium]|nr:(Fe-S)-binding protein [Chloroflexota bacterium]